MHEEFPLPVGVSCLYCLLVRVHCSWRASSHSQNFRCSFCSMEIFSQTKASHKFLSHWLSPLTLKGGGGVQKDLWGYYVSGLGWRSSKVTGRNSEDGWGKKWCGGECVWRKMSGAGWRGVRVMSGRWQIFEFFPCAQKAKEVVVWWSHIQNTYSLYPTLLPPSWGARPADYYTGGHSAASTPLHHFPPFHRHNRAPLQSSSPFFWGHLKTHSEAVQR